MKSLPIISSLTLSVGIFAQGPNTDFQINPPEQQAKNVSYYNQVDDNNSLGNSNKINDDVIQTNIAVQQANLPAQTQQGSPIGNIFSASENNDSQNKKPYCKECEEVKKALAAAHASSGRAHHKRASSFGQWKKKLAYDANLKMKKVVAHKYKVKTSYEVCFLWH